MNELVREYKRTVKRKEKPSAEARAAYNQYVREGIQRRKDVHDGTTKRKPPGVGQADEAVLDWLLASAEAGDTGIPPDRTDARPEVRLSSAGPKAVPTTKAIRAKERSPHPEPFRPTDIPSPVTTRYFRQSEIKAFKACPRSWWLSYQRGGAGYSKPPSASPQSGQRDVGTLVHAMVDAYYSGLDIKKVWQDTRDTLCEQLGGPLPKEWLDVFQLADIMVHGYVQWLREEYGDVGEKTLFSEKAIEIPIGQMHGDEIFLTCKIDRIVQDTLSGEVLIEDTKTVATFGEYATQLQVDDQGLMYAIMAKGGLNLDVHRFRHNMLRKVKRSPKAIPPFYMRHEVRYSEEQLDNAWTHMMAVVSRMTLALQAVEADEDQHHVHMYPNPTRDCSWRCDFLPICPMLDDGSYWQDMLEGSGLYVPRPGR